MQRSQLSRGRTRQDHLDHAGKCQQQLVREFLLLRKRVGQRLKVRRLSQSRRASATSQRRVWRGFGRQPRRDGKDGDSKRKRPSSDELSAAFSFPQVRHPRSGIPSCSAHRQLAPYLFHWRPMRCFPVAVRTLESVSVERDAFLAPESHASSNASIIEGWATLHQFSAKSSQRKSQHPR
jgi:hypothetical protein